MNPNTELRYPGAEFRKPFDQEIAKYATLVAGQPDDASALAGLAEAYINAWCYGFLRRTESLSIARPAAMKAVEAEPDSAEAHTVLGIIKLADWDWTAAEEHLQQAVSLSPDSYKARHWYSLYLSAMGRHESAIGEAEIANELDAPAGSTIGYASILYFAHEFERQAELLEKWISDGPHFAPLFDWLGMAYVQLGEFDKSIEVYEKAALLSDGLAEIMGGLGHAYGLAGRTSQARDVLGTMLACADRWYVPPVQIAFVYFGLGEVDEALSMLERAYDERSWELAFMRTEPWLDHLHANQHFADIMGRLRFPEK